MSGVEAWTDRHDARRKVPLKVLVLGLPFTGTSSIASALDRLGYHGIYDMSSCVLNPPDIGIWQEAIDAKWFGKGPIFSRKDWDQVLGHCEVAAGVPSAAFAHDLIKAYPEAKVIIPVIKVNDWYQKTDQAISLLFSSRAIRIASTIDPYFLGPWIHMIHSLLNGFFGNDCPVEKKWKSTFICQNQDIKKWVPPERLLEFRAEDGWAILCAFLGKSTPQEAFPEVPEEVISQKNISNIVIRSAKVLVTKIIAGIGPIIGFGAALFLARSAEALNSR